MQISSLFNFINPASQDRPHNDALALRSLDLIDPPQIIFQRSSFDFEVVIGLQVHPELRCCPEESGEA